MNKIKHVILIDDNKIDLFINQKVIEKYFANVKIIKFSSASLAIDYFKSFDETAEDTTLVIPDFIFLDINMPQMNGFQFLKEYRKLKFIEETKIDVFMLSSSLCETDMNLVNEQKLCNGLINKPLTVTKLQKFVSGTVQSLKPKIEKY